MKSKIPVHIVRFEDILCNTKPTMMNLMKFILNEQNLDGTQIERYIDLTVQEKAPEVYKPRSGQINKNIDKYQKEDLEFIYNFAKDQLVKFGYE